MTHEKYMAIAIEEAKKGKGKTFLNPLVGAVIVKNQRIIATGAHLAYGKKHAEKNAVLACKKPEELHGATIYVTLEPCSHYGKQPPCTQTLIESGIKRAVIGQLDPNPLVAGKGRAALEKSGIKTIAGLLEQEVRALNPYYNYYFEYNRPYIVLKQAITLDGKLALRSQRTPLTGAQANAQTHEERGNYQGLLVGSQTVLTDNPYLLAANKKIQQPIRIILDRRGRTLAQPNLNIFIYAESPVWIFTEKQTYNSKLPGHVEIICQTKASIKTAVEELTKRKLQSLYVEGGAKIHDAFLASGLWDEIISYIAPKVIGGNALASMSSRRQASKAIELASVSFQAVGKDLRICGRRI